MHQDPGSLAAFLDGRHKEIAAAHRAGASGFATCAALTSTMDAALRTAFESLSPSSRAHIAIMALGGYGRAELCPQSDVDVMVLCAPGGSGGKGNDAAKGFLHLLWDAGVNIGHSVRTVDEAMALHGQSLDAWTSMLEGRFICGDSRLADSLITSLRRQCSGGSDAWFVEGVFADMRSRHERYGASVRLLEPNIKKSAGAFRDIQMMFWLYRAHEPAYFFPLDPAVPATKAFLERLRADNLIDADEGAAAVKALEFLFRVRHEMHYLQTAPDDTLQYALQLKVAEGLGYARASDAPAPRSGEHNVEVFMRDYYLHARTIHVLGQSLGHRFREAIESRPFHTRVLTAVRRALSSGGDANALAPAVKRFDYAEQLFDAFVFAAEKEIEPDFRVRSAIARSVDLISAAETRSPALAAKFRRVFASRRVAATLHEMNDLDVLGRYIPEFGELVAFFQHNVYHYYTADEHTLIAIANAERLRDRSGPLHDIFRSLQRKDMLYMAILLHDIAKPLGVGDHEITGVGIARTVLERLGMNDIFPDVAFLVRNHLVMEQTAFRRNVHDPDTIREFAARFERPEQLDYLCILTYADLSAVNPGVWTEWKAAMLLELYQRTSEVLRRHLRGAQIEEYHQARQEEAVEGVVGRLSALMPREQVERHLKGMLNDSYIAVFTEEEIGQHIDKGVLQDPVSTIFAHTEGYTEVTVIARDAPYALSRFCAVLAANDANIFDANIFTRDDGVIIDRFRVWAASSKQQLDASVCRKIDDDLKLMAEGKLDIDHLFREHRRRWRRRPKPPSNPNIRTDVQFEDNPRYTIIDVYAPDSVGFLYRITETISRLGLDIYFAKIATRVDGIVDAFYTFDRSGRPVTDAARREEIRSDILSTIEAISREELE